jgi:hypothetical protein
MNEFIAPTDLSSGKIIFIAYVSSSQHRIKVKDLLWVNTSLPYMKRNLEILSKAEIIQDIESDYYTRGDMFTERTLIHKIFS